MERKYKKNYLKEVIVRIDFPILIEEIKEELPNEIKLKILKSFPIPEERDLNFGKIKLEFNSATPTVIEEKSIGKEWLFYEKNREKHVCLSMDHMHISYSKYESYSKMKEDFLNIYSILLDFIKDLKVKRFGLRYINTFPFNDGLPTDWSRYINRDLLCSFNFYDNKSIISRAFQVLELNHNDINLRFQYGMPNPDYPSPIRKKIFILDYDAYFQGLIEKNSEVEDYLNSCHEKIEELFELSITEDLRRILNEQE